MKRQGYAVEWAFDDDGAPISMQVNLTESTMAAFKASMDDSRFSYSVEGGELEDMVVGENHPTSLGDGMLDFIPDTARTLDLGTSWSYSLLPILAARGIRGSPTRWFTRTRSLDVRTDGSRNSIG